jgi:hypothetical protein
MPRIKDATNVIQDYFGNFNQDLKLPVDIDGMTTPHAIKLHDIYQYIDTLMGLSNLLRPVQPAGGLVNTGTLVAHALNTTIHLSADGYIDRAQYINTSTNATVLTPPTHLGTMILIGDASYEVILPDASIYSGIKYTFKNRIPGGAKPPAPSLACYDYELEGGVSQSYTLNGHTTWWSLALPGAFNSVSQFQSTGSEWIRLI